MTPSSRRLPRHGALPKSVARPVLAALTVLSVVLVTALAVHLGVGPAAALNGAGPQGATVQVAQPGRHYISSSSTDRPVLSLSGWTDARGQALDAPDNAQTKAVAVHIRVVDEDGWYQAGVVYPEFIAGQADYALPLWPFTNDMDPHEGTYRIEWRASSSDPWVLADTIGLDARLPQPGPCAGLEQSGSSLVGTGWTFDRTTSFGGIYKVALALALPDGTVSHVNVRAYFSGTRFLLDIADLVAAGAPAGGGYTVTALAHGQPTTTSVRIPSAPVEQPMSSPQPSPSPSAEPTADPTVEPTADPTAAPPAEPTAEPVPSIEPSA
ncbi:MAG: PT domain-containing protein, partial [Actinomyces sp.]|uniref:PT domain-containing protein n=1 Tax=Actinomyces sp. TaxID=29317 RepID=UPI0026DD29B4